MRALPLVLVLLLVLAPITGVSALSTDTVTRSAASAVGSNTSVSNHTASNQTGHVLSIPEGELQRSTTNEQHVDLGPAVGFGSNASAAQIETHAVIEQIERADTAERRSERIGTAFETIERRTERLHEREQEAIRAYGAGEVTPRAFLIELARIDARANALDDRRARLVETANEDETVEIDRGRVASVERRIGALTGPVRAHARDVLQGRNATNRFFVATGPDSLVLSTITDGTYVREAFRGDRYNPGSSTDIDPETALDIAAQSYPVLWELRQDNTDVVGSDGNYIVRIPHERGELRAFVDGESRSVYKEFQTRSLASFEHTKTTTATRDGFELSANYTYPGGPVQLRLIHAESETPVDANVTLSENGQESELLGRSGIGGTLWTLSPQGEYTITAIRGNDVVVLTIPPIDPPRAGATESTTDGNESTTDS